jgi:hypothetical protein
VIDVTCGTKDEMLHEVTFSLLEYDSGTDKRIEFSCAVLAERLGKNLTEGISGFVRRTGKVKGIGGSACIVPHKKLTNKLPLTLMGC